MILTLAFILIIDTIVFVFDKLFTKLRSILQVKVVEPEGGHYEEYDGVKHWVPAGYYWVWKWDYHE